MAKKVKLSGDVSSPSNNNRLDYDYIEGCIKRLAGKILTIIDGAIVIEKQNKAVKDQIKNEIKELLYDFQEKAFKGERGQSVQL